MDTIFDLPFFYNTLVIGYLYLIFFFWKISYLVPLYVPHTGHHTHIHATQDTLLRRTSMQYIPNAWGKIVLNDVEGLITKEKVDGVLNPSVLSKF